MKYKDALKEKIEQFCVSVCIDPLGKVTESQKISIDQFVAYQIKKDKIDAKRRKDDDSLKISSSIIHKKTGSPIEDILYEEMIKQSLDVYFIPQYEIGPYRCDFASPELMLVVECDGIDFHSSEKQVKHDKKRDAYMKNFGWEIIRIQGQAIYMTPQHCISKLKEVVEKRSQINA